MPLLDPVTPFLALIDRLISLLKERQTRHKDYFEKIVAPLYADFTPVAEDLLNTVRDATRFTGTQSTLSGQERRTALASFYDRRETLLRPRQQLRGLLAAFDNSDDIPKDIRDFVRLMEDFLYSGPPIVIELPAVTPHLSIAISLACQGMIAGTKQLDGRPFQMYYLDLETYWSTIARHYMALKIKYITK